MNYSYQNLQQDFIRGVVIFSSFALCASLAYAAIAWPSTPAGEVSGGKYALKLVPTGAIIAFNSATCPSGWLPADGSAGTPDLRGEFIRGLDNGRGVDTGRLLNTPQSATSLPFMGVYRTTASAGILVTPTTAGYSGDGDSKYPSGLDEVVSTVNSPYFMTNLVPSGGHSTSTFKVRPRNVAFLYCIKN